MVDRQTATSEIGSDSGVFYSVISRIPVALKGRPLLRKLRLMAETDETVGAMLYAIETTLAQVAWSHEPQVDGKKDDTDPQAVKMALFADTLLADMDLTYSDHVEESLLFLWAGFGLFEIVLKQREEDNSEYPDGLWGFKSLRIRDPESVVSWVKEGSDYVAFTQASGKKIPLWKTLHYKTRGGPTRPQGNSIFKNAYFIWDLKRKVQVSEALGIERELCGLPVGRLPMRDIIAATTPLPSGELSDEGKAAKSRIQAMTAATQDMRLNEAGGLVLPSDPWLDEDDKPLNLPQYSFEIMTSAGQRSVDARTTARDHDRAIARVAMMQFLHLGDRAGGSYGLSDDQSSMGMRAIRSLLGKFKEQWRAKALTLAWEMNGLDKKYMPGLQSSPITEDTLEAIGKFLGDLSSADEFLSEEPDLKKKLVGRISGAA